MIQTADNVAEKYNVTREDCDKFAYASQQKAIAAIDAGRFVDEIVPIDIPQRKADPIHFAVDEYPKRNVSLEKMGKLRTLFPNGVTTAGNASGRNDGAVAMLLMSEEKAAQLGLKPMAELLGGSAAGVDPRYMGIAPVAAINKLMANLEKTHGITLKDIDLVEINEAFAAQCIACAKTLKIDEEKLNVNGSGISLGHPVGATGRRLVVSLIHELKRRGGRYGLASLCAGGGMGTTVIIEMV